MGVKELKEALDFGIAFGNAVGNVMEDGKFSLTELTEFVSPIVKLPSALDGISLIGDEIRDLDEEEADMLKTHFIEEFDIPQDNVEEYIEASVSLLQGMVPLLRLVLAKKSNPEDATE